MIAKILPPLLSSAMFLAFGLLLLLDKAAQFDTVNPLNGLLLRSYIFIVSSGCASVAVAVVLFLNAVGAITEKIFDHRTKERGQREHNTVDKR